MPYNSTPATGYSVSETGNYLSGQISLGETGIDRNGLINGFNNISNAVASNGPGDLDYSPVGAPFHIGGSPIAGAGPVGDINAAATDAAFNELGLQLLHEYCWRGTTYAFVADDNEKPTNAVLKLIREIREGDLVLCPSDRDPHGPSCWRRVGKAFKNKPARLLELTTDRGNMVYPTHNHPVYVVERGWTPAGMLKRGDPLLSRDGTPLRVANVTETGVVEDVYNLFVEGHHTYFVSDGDPRCAFLAHNISDEALAARHLTAPPTPPSAAPAGGGQTFVGAAINEIKQLPETIKEFPKAFRETQQNGKQADSFMGHINGYTDSLNPFGGGIPTKPIAGNQDAYRAGQGLGHKVGFVANAVMTVSGVKGTVTAVQTIATSGGKAIQVARLALPGGGSVPVIMEGGQAVVLTAERAAALGIPAGKAAVGYGNLLQSTTKSGSSGGGTKQPPNPNGSVGKADHQKAVKQMEKEFRAKYPESEGYELRSNKSIHKETGLNKRPDVAAVKNGKVADAGEVARVNQDGSLVPREAAKQQAYKDAGIPSTVKKIPK